MDYETKRAHSQSMNEAHKNIENILQEICQKKWEKEVLEKRFHPATSEWVFASAQECQMMLPDPNQLTSQFD